MKKTTILMLFMFCLIFVFGACGSKEGSGSSDTAATTETGEPDAETDAETDTETDTEPDAETAMNNFVNKLEAGNYVIDADDYIRTTVYSPEQIYFIHNNETSDLDFGFVTVNGETFHGILEGDSFTEIGFEGPDNAIDAAMYTLPNYWISLSEGNMWNLFYNSVDQPLEFTSNDENVKITLLGLRGYGEAALDTMEEVHMIFDAEDPASVRFTAHFEPGGMIHFDDLDLTLQFGIGTSEPRIDKWAENPVYPPTRSGWTSDDINMMLPVFGRDYCADTIPFPDFASYAMFFDPNAYAERTEILIRDARATEKDVEDYKALLLDHGYTAETETDDDGSSKTVYRKLLRPDYDAYAQLYPCYEKGFALTGRMYYIIPKYDGQAAVNEALMENGFPAAPETDIFGEWTAENGAHAMSESWAYFFDYDLYMPFELSYEDEAAARAYFEEYGRLLTGQGFRSAYAPNLDGGEYRDANESGLFRYEFREDGTIFVEAKREKALTAEEARALIAAHGLPEINLSGDISSRDITRYYYQIMGFKGLQLSCTQPFEDAAAAEKFLDDYVASIEDLGYERTPPQTVGSNKENLYVNEELNKRVAFSIIPGDDGTAVIFDFVSVEDDEPDMLQNMIRR